MATNATQNPTTTSPPSNFPSAGTGTQPGQTKSDSGLQKSDLGQQKKNDPGQEQNQQRSGSQPQPEGKTARAIEQQTAKVPSDVFLWAALGALGSSLVLRAAQRDQASTFLGQWVSPLLLFGVYNKLVKLHGSDRFNRSENLAR